jgi:peptidoglycan/xylan/chitin deacetylase (PgdA/CDA1 family)
MKPKTSAPVRAPAALTLVALLVYLALLANSSWVFGLFLTGGETIQTPETDEAIEPPPAPADPEPEPGPPQVTRVPVEVRGIYMTAYSASSPETVGKLIRLVEETDLNAIVIDFKDNTGYISYPVSTPAALEMNAIRSSHPDLPSLLEDLESKGIFAIARIVVFQDPVAAQAKPEWAIRTSQGEPWRDAAGYYWLNPYSQEAWEYIVDISKEAALLGFREIQYDYVRFPDSRARSGAPAVLDNPLEMGRVEAINAFLDYAYEELQPYDVFVSADIFGFTTSASDDMGIGQDFSSIVKRVDYVCPMIYPSHYYDSGIYGLADPEADPYRVVRRALEDAWKRMGGAKAIMRPWLQDFSLRHRYGVAEVEAQIRAAHELGVTEWILWNPANVYTRPVDYMVAYGTGSPPAVPSVQEGPYEPNELGQVMILEYHEVGPEEKRWARTYQNFRSDLETLYEEGYRLVSLRDYLDGTIDLPKGYSPVILTFDDSTPGQFRYLEEEDTLLIDPQCAVGILEEFYREHPDFGLEATFYVLLPHPFGQPALADEKLRYILEVGMDLGNHTWNHSDLRGLSSSEVSRQLALPVKHVYEVTRGYTLDTLSLPYGSYPIKNIEALASGEYEETAYANKGVLLVGAGPAPSPYSLAFDPLRLPRIQAIQSELDKWMHHFRENPEDLYVSDGNADVVTFPSSQAGRLDAQATGRKTAAY